MKTTASFLLISLAILAAAHAQQPYSETFRFTEQRVNMEEKVPVKAQLLYPDFSGARVYFRDGQTSEGRVNFNMLLDELVHLDRRGQVMITSGQVDSVLFDNGAVIVFHPDHGFLERITTGGRTTLYGKHQLRVNTETYVQGPYGQQTRSSSVTRVRTLDTGTGEGPEREFYLENPGGETMEVKVRYQVQTLLRTESGLHRVFNRRQLQGALPEFRQDVRNYLREHNVSFTDLNDMRKLTDFINQL